MEVIPERGDIWWVALDPTLGPEIRKTRPCIVMSVKVLNERRRTVIVVPLSSSPNGSPPILIPISCGGQPAVAVSDQIRVVAKERLRSRLGAVTTEEMAALEEGALGRSCSLDEARRSMPVLLPRADSNYNRKLTRLSGKL